MIQVEEVTKVFRKVEAVSTTSFRIPEGLLCGLVGSDGAGKTTLLKMMATMIRPTAGRILVGGHDVVKAKTKAKDLIGYMPQRFGLYPDLTVEENLNFFMDIYGISGSERKRRKEAYLGFSNLTPFLDRMARDLSGGMKQKLGLACVLVHEPKVLILDEPTNGVDPVSRQEFWEILFEMKQKGMTICVSTAYLDEGERCERLLLMHRSRVLEEGSPQDIRSHFPNLEEAMIQRIQEVDRTLTHEQFIP